MLAYPFRHTDHECVTISDPVKDKQFKPPITSLWRSHRRWNVTAAAQVHIKQAAKGSCGQVTATLWVEVSVAVFFGSDCNCMLKLSGRHRSYRFWQRLWVRSALQLSIRHTSLFIKVRNQKLDKIDWYGCWLNINGIAFIQRLSFMDKTLGGRLQ